MVDKKQMLEQLLGLLPEVLPEIERVNRSRSLAGGSHHQHYFFEVVDKRGATFELVARVPLSTDERTHKHMLVEHTLLQFLHQQSLDWMPNSLFHGLIVTRQATPVPFSIQSYIRGTRPGHLTREQATELARRVAELHSLTVSPALVALLPFYQAWEDYAQALLVSMQQWFETLAHSAPPTALIDLLPPVERMLQKVGATVLARPAFIQAATGRQYIVHGDIGRHNLLQGEEGASDASGATGVQSEQERLYLMDWEFAGSGDPAFDIAVILQSPHLKQQWRSLFISTYSTLLSGNSFEDFWQRVAFYGPIVTGHTVLWALGELFKAWPGVQTLYQVDWYAHTLRTRLALIDPFASVQAAALLDKVLRERFADS